MDVSSLPLEDVNAGLSGLLGQLQEGGSSDDLTLLARKLNGSLYSIINSPHIPAVNAVQLQINTSSDVSLSRDAKRELWLKYVQMMQVDSVDARSCRFLFTAHLPYVFTTGTLGSAERDALFSSYENLKFGCNYDSPFQGTCALNISGGSSPFGEVCRFFSSEIESLKLTHVANSQFSPFYQMSGKPLQQAHSALEHYLGFMGFNRDLVRNEEVPSNLPRRDDIVSFIRENTVTIPDGRRLLRQPWNTDLLQGFVAVKSASDVVVYEFTDVHLPQELLKNSSFGKRTLQAVYAILCYSEDERKVTTSIGDDAIARLRELGVKREF